jgi:hypothetical protein
MGALTVTLARMTGCMDMRRVKTMVLTLLVLATTCAVGSADAALFLVKARFGDKVGNLL